MDLHAQLEEASGMTAEQAEPVKHAEALWTRQIPAGGAAELCKKSDDYEQPDKVHVLSKCVILVKCCTQPYPM